tara:strand:+ start:584 stop:2311 length:1728 start_codon:yes stop_codon:yes gene_type:complete
MLIVNCNIIDEITSKLIATTILFNENDLSYTLLPMCEHLTSKLPQTTMDDYKIQGRTANRPFGITSDNDNIYIASNEKICSFDINTLEYKKDISSTGRVNTHEIYYHNGYIYRCDTAVNCITIINVNTLEETYIDIVLKKQIDNLYSSKQTRDKDIFHINSITINENILYITCKGYSNMINLRNKSCQYTTFRDIYNEIVNLSDTEYDNSEIISTLNNIHYDYKYDMQDILSFIDLKEKISMEILVILEDYKIYNNLKSLINLYNQNDEENGIVAYYSFINIDDTNTFFDKINTNHDKSIISDDLLIRDKYDYINKNKKVFILIIIDKKQWNNYKIDKKIDSDILNDDLNEEPEIIRAFLRKRKYDSFKMRLSNILNTNNSIDSTLNSTTIQIQSDNNNFDDCIRYINTINEKNKTEYLSTLPKKRCKEWKLNLILQSYFNSIPSVFSSEIIRYNIETKEFIEKPIILNTSASHNMIIIDNYIWTLGTSDGKLYKTDINTNQHESFSLIDPNLYFLRGLLNKENFLYIFASTNRYNRHINKISSKFIIYNINEDSFVCKDLDIKIRSIRDAKLYS